MTLTRTSRILIVTITAAVVTLPGLHARQAPAPETLLGEGLHLEEVESNFAGAAAIYRRVAADPRAPRSVVARALLQLAGCYERLGQPQARATYERIVAQHADSGPVAAAARERLAAIQARADGPTERLIATDRSVGGLGAPRWSPDGRFVIGMPLSASELDGRGLFLRNIETTGGHRLFSRAPGFATGFWGFSPDGRQYAALMPEMVPQSVIADAIRAGSDPAGLSTRGVLVVGGIDLGAQPTVLDIPRMALVPLDPFMQPLAWSPDSRWLALALPASPFRSSDIQLLNAANGERRPLGFTPSGSIDLHWSPSGVELLVHVAATPQAPADLRLITVATAQGRSLPLPGAPGARLRVVRWTRTGEIAIRHLDPATPQVEDTYLLNVASGVSRKTCSGQAVNLAGTGGMPNAAGDLCREITADGTRQIVWRHASKQLVVRDLATGVERPLTTSPGEEYYGILSPDDRIEVFVSNRDGRWALYAAEVDRAPAARPTRLSTFDDLPTSISLETWTPNGFIATVYHHESNIVRVNVDPATGRALSEERLTQDGILNHTPAVSPDGSRIAYWSRHGSRFGLAVMDSNGANERLLVEASQWYPGLQPSWRSPSEILFTPPPAGTSATMFVAPAPGTPLLMSSLNITTGAVAPVGELKGLPPTRGLPQYVAATGEVLHLDADYQAIVSQSLVDGRAREVVRFDGDVQVASFLAAPDGRRIAYVLAQPYSSGLACFSRAPTPVTDVEDIARPCEINLLTVATGERRVLATQPGRGAAVPSLVAWSPDGRYLLFGGGRPQIVDTTNGTRWPLLEPRVPLSWDQTASWSPDGTFVVLTNRTQRQELKEWRGVR